MRFRNGDTLVARITPCLENGKTAFVNFLAPDEIAWGSTEYIVLRSKDPIPAYWTYLLARSDDFRAEAIQSMTGSSGRQRVQQSAITGYKVVNASTNVYSAFGSIVQPMADRIDANIAQSRKLAALRDLLLPRLLSGEIRVPLAEKAVEAAL